MWDLRLFKPFEPLQSCAVRTLRAILQAREKEGAGYCPCDDALICSEITDKVSS